MKTHLKKRGKNLQLIEVSLEYWHIPVRDQPTLRIQRIFVVSDSYPDRSRRLSVRKRPILAQNKRSALRTSPKK